MSCTPTQGTREPFGDLAINVETSAQSNEMICSFYLEGRCRFGEECHNKHPPGIDPPKRLKSRNPKIKSDDESIPEDCPQKKPPLKTAGDVRKRIQWDPELKKEHFTVGYLDRFCGIIEKPFTAFTWEHLSLVEQEQLAIPQHRIQFYKYKGIKVWDKNERLDHVFGSVGSNITITDVIQSINNDELAESRQTCDREDSDDDNEIIILETGSTSAKSLTSAIFQRLTLEEEPLRATHFFCIRVNSEEVRQNVALVQEKIVQGDSTLRSCVMPRELLHVTLAMVKLNSIEAVYEAGNLLSELRNNFRSLFDSLTESKNDGYSKASREVQAKGISTFGARVLYANLDVPETFNSAVDILRSGLRRVPEATVTSHFDFVPHMTLLKVNRFTSRERRSKYVNSCLYSDYIDHNFGSITINNINLCVIDDNREPDGFYRTCREVEF